MRRGTENAPGGLGHRALDGQAVPGTVLMGWTSSEKLTAACIANDTGRRLWRGQNTSDLTQN
jgi:hypothetical protein